MKHHANKVCFVVPAPLLKELQDFAVRLQAQTTATKVTFSDAIRITMTRGLRAYDSEPVPVLGEAPMIHKDIVIRHHEKTTSPRESTSLPLLLTCPSCGVRHVDQGEFATKPHHTHACQSCGMCWRPAVEPTVGVQFLPGFKDGEP